MVLLGTRSQVVSQDSFIRYMLCSVLHVVSQESWIHGCSKLEGKKKSDLFGSEKTFKILKCNHRVL